MSNKIAIAAFGAVLTLGLTTEVLATTHMPKADKQTEKCYGISKAGKNDCGGATAQCAGSATKDAQKDAWILLPKGTCEKIVGGSTSEGKA